MSRQIDLGRIVNRLKFDFSKGTTVPRSPAVFVRGRYILTRALLDEALAQAYDAGVIAERSRIEHIIRDCGEKRGIAVGG